jgi:hypothetical protein
MNNFKSGDDGTWCDTVVQDGIAAFTAMLSAAGGGINYSYIFSAVAAVVFHKYLT